MRFFIQLPSKEKRLTWATIFTLARIAIIPFIVRFIMIGNWFSALIFFLIASITDCVDGNIARWWNEKTVLGALLDPVADKLLIISSLVALYCTRYVPFNLPTWFFVSIIGKELFVAAGTLFLYACKKVGEIRPTIFGKGATMIHMIVIGWVLFLYYCGGACGLIDSAWIPLFVSAMLACIVSSQYAYLGLRIMFFSPA